MVQVIKVNSDMEEEDYVPEWYADDPLEEYAPQDWDLDDSEGSD